MYDHTIVVAGLLAFSSLPVASAKKVCTQTSTGEQVCHDTFPTKAKVAIAIVSVTVVFLMLSLCLFVRRTRKASAEAAKECSVEASQMEGPPTVLAATYNPASGHSIYAIGSAESVPIQTAVVNPTPTAPGTPAVPTPAFPSPAVQSRAPYTPGPNVVPQPRTAPAHKTSFSYPFTGMGSNSSGSGSSQPPKSAFVSGGGFPRPLLAGRLKDRIRERPPSVSSVPSSPKA